MVETDKYNTEQKKQDTKQFYLYNTKKTGKLSW